jgi:1-phosphofructokinase family hexose kinase
VTHDIACIAPNPSIDRLFAVERIALGEIHRPLRLVAQAGGKGLNVARAAHALGSRVLALPLLAGHAGRWIAEQLDGAGVPADPVWAPGETRISLSVVARAGAGPTEFYERGEPPGEPAWATFVAHATSAATRARWISLSGSLPPGVPATESAKIVREARASGALVAVDQEGAALAAALGERPQLVKVNAAEAAHATGSSDPLTAARVLLGQTGGRAAIVTAGVDGAYAAIDDGSAWHAALPDRGDYPSGSGDAFLAGVLRSDPPAHGWQHAIALGLGAATANALVPGAGILDPKRARALAARTRVVRAG